jgi:hypothetical protein
VPPASPLNSLLFSPEKEKKAPPEKATTCLSPQLPLSPHPLPARLTHAPADLFHGPLPAMSPIIAQGNTILHEAVRNGQTEAVRALIAAGADVKAKDVRGRWGWGG